MSTKQPPELAAFDGVWLEAVDFCARTDSLLLQLNSTRAGLSSVRRLSTETARKLKGELLPIGRFLKDQESQGAHLLVKWINGSQGHDAEIRPADGSAAIEYIEVTRAQHPNEHLAMQLLDEKGGAMGLDGIRPGPNGQPISEPISYHIPDMIRAAASRLVKAIQGKALHTFAGPATLLVSCEMDTLYANHEWSEVVKIVRQQLPLHSFRRIYAFDAGAHHLTEL